MGDEKRLGIQTHFITKEKKLGLNVENEMNFSKKCAR